MNISRRRLLAVTGISCATAIAGCTGSDDQEIPSIDESIPLPEDHPELFEEDLHRDNNFVLYWFWVPNPTMVESQIEFLVELQEEYPELIIVSINRRDEEKNNLYIKRLQTHFDFDLENVSGDDIELPATAIGTEFFQGDSSETRNEIRAAVDNCANNSCPNAFEWMDERIEEHEQQVQQELREQAEAEEDEEDTVEEDETTAESDEDGGDDQSTEE